MPSAIQFSAVGNEGLLRVLVDPLHWHRHAAVETRSSHSGPAVDLLAHFTREGIHVEPHVHQLWLIGEVGQIRSISDDEGAREGLAILAGDLYDLSLATMRVPIDNVQ